MPATATRAAAPAPEQPTKRAPVLSPSDRHVVARLTFGTTPRVVKQVRRRGVGPWLDRQLSPGRVADPTGDAVDGWWPHLSLGAEQVWKRHLSGEQPGWELMRDYASWVLLRRIGSEQQVLEVMTSFWENHLHVAFNSDSWPWRADYGRMLRRHALGSYEEMLVEAIVHPAMLIWLNGDRSTKAAPNENLGRELLELFTLGVGNYGEDDVKDAARILTGWRVDTFRTWARSYRSEDHHVGRVRVADFSHANAEADGRPVVEALLRHLARHPATAHHLARRIAVKFVRDDPPESLVRRLADTYLEHGTQIAPVLRALVGSPEFAAAEGLKLRDPAEDVVATYRALGSWFQPPARGLRATEAIVWQTGLLGLQIGDWPRPDGAPLENAAWATSLRALASVDLHRTLAHGWWPDEEIGATHRDPASWVPAYPIRFERLVDHVSRLLLGRRASTAVVEAACLALGYQPTERIDDPEHELVRWRMGTLLTAVLDTPVHYHR